MKGVLLSLFLIMGASPAFSAPPEAAPASPATRQAGDLGLGVILGDPIGGTAKYWLNGTQALAFGIGSSGGFTAWADYAWHAWDLLPQPKEGRLGAYLSLGGRLEPEDDVDFGFRTLAGASYWLKDRPIELFAEAGPRFDVSGDIGADGAIGIRYHFSLAKK